jgi:FG-GAP-like repeat
MKPRCAALLAAVGLLVVSAAGAAGARSTDPTFAPGPDLPAGTVPGAAAVGDFDGNGSADLAVSDGGYGQNLRILLNDGAGRFRVAAGSPVDVGAGDLVSADFNRDGKADLALAGAELHVLLGDGAGRVADAPGSPIQLEGGPVQAADLNGDGSPDLVEAFTDKNVHKLRVLFNDGSGRFTFGASPPVAVKGDYFSFALADLSADGKADLAVADGVAGKVAILLGDGTGAFGTATRFPIGKNVGQLVVGDFNGDRKVDLADPVAYGVRVVVLPGTGAGRFGRALTLKVAAGAYEPIVADFDQDGRSDLAVFEESGIAILFGTTTGKLRPSEAFGFGGVLASADFDGDSRPDIASLSGSPWWPAQRGSVILFQTHSAPDVEQGRALPARADAVLSTRKPIGYLAADGSRVAACLETYRRRGFVVWTAPGHKALAIHASCYDDIALAAGRVAWIVEYALPNEPELTLVIYEQRLSDGRRRVIDRVQNESNHNDIRGPWLGQLFGGGSLLAWNLWDLDCLPPPPPLCEGDYCSECDPYNPTLRVSGQTLVVSNGRRARAHGSSALYPLRTVGGGRLAASPGGAVVVLAPNGSRVATVPAVETDPPREIALSRTRLAVTRTSTLDVYDPATGAALKSIQVGPAAALRLVGVNSTVAVLRGPSELVLVRLSDGKLVSMPLRNAAARGLTDAKLTSAGLFYAYNLRHGAKRGRIVFEPSAKLLGRF